MFLLKQRERPQKCFIRIVRFRMTGKGDILLEFYRI